MTWDEGEPVVITDSDAPYSGHVGNISKTVAGERTYDFPIKVIFGPSHHWYNADEIASLLCRYCGKQKSFHDGWEEWICLGCDL